MPSGFLSYFIYATAFTSFFLFVSNAIPLKNKSNLITDGRYLLDGLQNNPDYQHLTSLTALNALSLTSANPSAFFLPYLHQHQAVENPTLKVNFLVYEYYYYLDKNDQETAFQVITELNKYLEHYPKTQQKEIQKELLFAFTFLQADLARAEEIYQEIKDRLNKSKSVSDYRIQAAYALFINNDPEKALEFIHKGKLVADAYLMKSFIPMEKSLLTKLESIIFSSTKSRNL